MPGGRCASTASATLCGTRSCRQTGANGAAQIVVGPVRQRDGVMILAATAGHRLERPQHAPVQIALDRAGHRQRTLAGAEARTGTVRPDSAAAMR